MKSSQIIKAKVGLSAALNPRSTTDSTPTDSSFTNSLATLQTRRYFSETDNPSQTIRNDSLNQSFLNINNKRSDVENNAPSKRVRYPPQITKSCPHSPFEDEDEEDQLYNDEIEPQNDSSKLHYSVTLSLVSRIRIA